MHVRTSESRFCTPPTIPTPPVSQFPANIHVVSPQNSMSKSVLAVARALGR